MSDQKQTPDEVLAKLEEWREEGQEAMTSALCEYCPEEFWELAEALREAIRQREVKGERLADALKEVASLHEYAAAAEKERDEAKAALEKIIKAAKRVVERDDRWLAEQRNEDGSARSTYTKDALVELLRQALQKDPAATPSP